MKRLILVLAIIAIATPAFALTVTVTKPVDGQLQVKYAGADPANLPRAFALDLTIGSPATFTGITNYFVGECNTPPNTGYGIYPARITFDVNDDVNSWGNPLANPSDAGASGTGIGTNHLILEFASLYVDGNAPSTSGTLCDLTYNCNSGSNLAVSMTDEATYRGGVVLEDGTQFDVVGSLTVCVSDCFPSSFTTFAAWTSMGKPSCWCNTAAPWPTATGNYQCDGDADAKDSGSPFKYRIYSGDLALVITYWKKKITDYPGGNLNPCADIDHKDSGSPFKYRVYSNDLSKVITNWKKKDSALPGNCGLLSRPE